jgi:pilus assembly protein CpaC
VKKLAHALVLFALALTPPLMSSPVWAQRSGSSEEIILAIGESRTISLVGVTEYTRPNKEIVNYSESGSPVNALIIEARKEGPAPITVVRKDGSKLTYEITVVKRNPAALEKEVQDLIRDVPGVRTRRVGGRIIIDGAASTPGEKQRIDTIAAQYGDQVSSLVTVGTFNQNKLLVRLDFFFVQYEKTSGYNAGLGWPASIGGVGPTGEAVFQNSLTFDLISKTTTSAQAAVVNQPMPRLDLAARRGWVKIAKQSSVITANGSEALFENGGEQNFLVTTGFAANLVNVKFGTNVNVTPRYDVNSRDVELDIGADVADLTPATVANGPPGRTTTKLKTRVTLKLGQALVLSGIRTQTQRKAINGLPGLSEIPVLGVLFGSHANDKAETEGAVFIVPSVVDSVPKSALEMINNAMTTYKEYSGDIEYVEAYPKTPPNAR